MKDREREEGETEEEYARLKSERDLRMSYLALLFRGVPMVYERGVIKIDPEWLRWYLLRRLLAWMARREEGAA